MKELLNSSVIISVQDGQGKNEDVAQNSSSLKKGDLLWFRRSFSFISTALEEITEAMYKRKNIPPMFDLDDDKPE